MSKPAKFQPENSPAAPRSGSPRTAPRSGKPTRERAWSEVASFVVQFEKRAAADGSFDRRITAHKMEDGGITARWTGLAQQPMVDWIAQHLGEWGELPAGDRAPPRVDATPKEAPGQAEATPLPASAAMPPQEATASRAPWRGTPPILLSITEVVARQAGASGSAAGSSEAPRHGRSRLRGTEPFELDATIAMTGAPDQPAAMRAGPCKVEFFGRNVSTKQSVRLGEVHVAAGDAVGAAPSRGEALYRAHLGGLRLPPGTYRLDSIASLPTRSARLAHAEGPMLEVV